MEIQVYSIFLIIQLLALIKAVNFGRKDLLKALLCAGADFNVALKDGKTAFTLAMASKEMSPAHNETASVMAQAHGILT